MRPTTVSTTTWQRGQQPRAHWASGRSSAHIQEQRHGYARAVLRTLARTHRGRPTAEVQRVLNNALKPLGVSLSAPAMHKLALSIATGQPVELP